MTVDPYRPVYRPSHRVDLPAFLPLALLAVVGAVAIGIGLSQFLARPGYYPVLFPFVVALPVAGLVGVAGVHGRCRSPTAVAAFGAAVGLTAFVCHLQADMAAREGWQSFGRVDRLPTFLLHRLAEDSTFASQQATDQSPGPVAVGANVFILGLEAVVLGSIPAVIGHTVVDRCFDERTRLWTNTHSRVCPPGTGHDVVAALQRGDADELRDVLATASSNDPPCAVVAAEYAPSAGVISAWLTVGEVGPPDPQTGDPTGEETLARRWELTPAESAVVLAWFRRTSPP